MSWCLSPLLTIGLDYWYISLFGASINLNVNAETENFYLFYGISYLIILSNCKIQQNAAVTIGLTFSYRSQNILFYFLSQR